MSNQKKFDTLRNSKSITDGFRGVDAVRRIGWFLKNKDRFQVSDNNTYSLTQKSFGGRGELTFSGDYIKNIVLQVKLPAGTYVVENGWGAKILKTIRVRECGAPEYIYDGIHNAMISLRELEKDDIRDEYVNLLGAATTNPTTDITAFIFINILHSSINSGLAQFYPNYHARDNVAVSFEFESMSNVLTSGTTTLGDVIVHYEVGEFHNKPPTDKMHKEMTFGFEYVRIDDQLLTNGSVNRTIQLPSFEVSEYDELVMMVVLEASITAKNYLYGIDIKNKNLTLSNREIIKEEGDYHKIKSIMNYEKPITFNLSGSSRHLHVFELAPISYVKQIKSGVNHQGVKLSNETVILKFDTATTANSRAFLYGIRKIMRDFDGTRVSKKYIPM